jgi:hypothetical protein
LGTFTVNNIFQRFGAYLVVVPFTIIVFAFSYGILLPFGPLGVIGFAFVGVLWALFLGFITKRLMRREVWGRLLANAPVFLGIIATGLPYGRRVYLHIHDECGAGRTFNDIRRSFCLLS